MRVVILGAGKGFVGKELTKVLKAAGTDVLAVSSADADLISRESVGVLKGMIRPTDAVVFVSAITPDKGKDVNAYMKNVTMAQHVAEAVDATGCAYMLYISSDAVYGDGVNPVREDSPADSGTLYGQMHRTREIILKTALAPKKIPLMILRPTAVYGHGDTHNAYGPNRSMRLAIKGAPIPLFGNGEEKRDHLYIDDFCKIIQACIAGKIEGLINVASGHSVSFHEVAGLAYKTAKSEARIEPSPRANPITHRHFDITHLLRTLPSIKLTDITTGLEKYNQKEANV